MKYIVDEQRAKADALDYLKKHIMDKDFDRVSAVVMDTLDIVFSDPVEYLDGTSYKQKVE